MTFSLRTAQASFLVTALVGLQGCGAAPAQDAGYVVTVQAGAHDRHETPVSFVLPESLAGAAHGCQNATAEQANS
jgi:hypothetical protein